MSDKTFVDFLKETENYTGNGTEKNLQETYGKTELNKLKDLYVDESRFEDDEDDDFEDDDFEDDDL